MRNMRIYVPATLHELHDEQFGAGGRIVHAVTDDLRAALAAEVNAEYDEEDLEFAAFLAAADTSLDLLAGAPESIPRRLVIAADVPDDAVGPPRAGMPGADLPSALDLRHPLSEIEIVSFHVDEDTEEVRTLVSAAMSGDTRARAESDELDLLWFDVTERAELAP